MDIDWNPKNGSITVIAKSPDGNKTLTFSEYGLEKLATKLGLLDGERANEKHTDIINNRIDFPDWLADAIVGQARELQWAHIFNHVYYFRHK
jgi:hypothetical protein